MFFTLATSLYKSLRKLSVKSFPSLEESLVAILSQTPLQSNLISFLTSNRLSRGFAFLGFETEDYAEEAKRLLDNTHLYGQRLHVQYSRRCQPRDPTPGQYLGSKKNYVFRPDERHLSKKRPN